jgi:hypothetical protein
MQCKHILKRDSEKKEKVKAQKYVFLDVSQEENHPQMETVLVPKPTCIIDPLS